MSDDHVIPQLETLDATLDALDAPSTLETFRATLPWDADMVAAAAAQRAINGGGGGGGGSQPITRAQYRSDSDVTITIGDSAPLPWDTKVLGTALLDLSVPTAPTVVEAGVYAVTAAILIRQTIDADGVVTAFIDLDYDGDDLSVGSSAFPSSVIGKLTVVGTYYIPAGGKIVITVSNFGTAVSGDFGLYAYVQRLSGPE